MAPVAINGAITGTSPAANTVLTHGGGTLTLGGASTFAGNVQINGGNVALVGGNNRLPTTAAVSFANTARVLNVGTTTQTLANLRLPVTVSGNAGGGAGTVTGSGSLTITPAVFQVGPGGQDTAAVPPTQSAIVAASAQTLDLSGLGSFTYTNTTGTVRVGIANGSTNTVNYGQIATLTLAGTNALTAANFNVGDIGGSSDVGISSVNFGTANAINAPV